MQNQEEEEAADWEIEESDIQESWVLEEQARGESSGAADSSPGANNEAMNDDAEEMDANEGFVELKDDSIQGFFGHEGSRLRASCVMLGIDCVSLDLVRRTRLLGCSASTSIQHDFIGRWE